MSLSRLLTFCLLGFCCVGLNAGQQQLSLEHAGHPRSYRVFVPEDIDLRGPPALLLVLHGLRGNGQRIATLSGFDERASRDGFIVVYPDSLASRWNYLHGIPGAFDGPDDPGFLLALTDLLTRTYDIDPGRRYVAGISNGGFMAQRLACETGSRYAGFAAVAASAYAALPSSCSRESPVDALYLHGTEDQLVPWQGRQLQDKSGNRQQVTMSIAESLKYWATHNRCAAPVEVREVPPSGRSSGTSVRVYSSAGCAANSAVSLYAVIGGGHNWPGVEDAMTASISGRVNLDIHASDVIWRFFTARR